MPRAHERTAVGRRYLSQIARGLARAICGRASLAVPPGGALRGEALAPSLSAY